MLFALFHKTEKEGLLQAPFYAATLTLTPEPSKDT